jgi:hypothetical protein
MSTLTLNLPEAALQRFNRWLDQRGLTPESGFLELVKDLDKPAPEALGTRPPLHPDVLAITGIIPDDGRDYKAYREEYLDYLERKHR